MKSRPEPSDDWKGNYIVDQLRIENVLRQALQQDRLHFYGFRSGGGLRVVSLDGDDQHLYGEHPNVMDALDLLCDDYEAGGREYADVYMSGERSHYLTGSSEPDSELDRWILRGYTIRAKYRRGAFIIKLQGWQKFELPPGVMEEVIKTGEPHVCRDRGYIYTTTKSQFPNGENCVYINHEREDGDTSRSGADPHMWRAIKTAEAQSFFEAVDKALVAEYVEAQHDPGGY